MTFQAGKHAFLMDGKPFYLYSGEIQYFRLDRALWRAHLTKLKDAGANTVSTYIPWSWHEIEEGRFDFTGETHPSRDLVGFLDLAAELGLYLSVKPGPYILAEFEDRGIPAWLTEGHPEIQARGVDMITYLHPVFQRYTLRWFDAVLPLLASRQITRGGRILLLQVCNEVGLYNWLDGAGDTSPVSLNYFRSYLARTHKTIAKLNAAYGTRYRSFASVPAPTRRTQGPGDVLHWNDWHDFHRWYYAEYLEGMIRNLRSRGIEIQLFHNIPGWVYGRGQEYPVNISFYADIVRRCPDLIFGVDHIPENPNYRNQHDDLVINEMLRALQGGEKPIWAAEQQAGTREHTVHTFPNEMELFYKACLARGMTGMNFYMFSQGLNPPRRGAFGPTFYWMTALGHDAAEKPLYPVIRKIGGLVNTFGTALAASHKRSSTAVAWYRPYYHDEFYFPLFGGVPKLDAAAAGLRYTPKIMRNTYFFEGWLRMLTLQNQDYTIVDVQTTVPDPKRVKQLWVMALDCMDRATQERLADYVEAGGHLVLGPGLPDRDLRLRPCRILGKRLGIQEGPVARKTGIAKIDLLGLEDLNALSPVRTFSAPGAQVIARTPEGKGCGLRRRVGKGTVTLLGTLFTYNIKEHLWAFDRLLRLDGGAPNALVSNPAIQAHVRYGRDHAFLFLLNYTPVSQRVHAEVKAVPGCGDLRVPGTGELRLAPHAGLCVPLNWPLNGGRRLLWATAEILASETTPHGVRWEVDSTGAEYPELVLAVPEGRLEAEYQGAPVPVREENGQVHILLPASPSRGSLEIRW